MKQQQYTYTKKDLCQRYGREIRTINRTIKAAGLNVTKKFYTDYEVTHLIDPARKLFDRGLNSNRISYLLDDKDPDGTSLADYLTESSSFSKHALSDIYKISIDTVRKTLKIAQLDPSRDDFTHEEVDVFQRVRALFEYGWSAQEIVKMSASGKIPDVNPEEHLRGYSKREIAARYDLSYDTVKRTLKACGIDTSKRFYSKEELQNFFEPARRLFENDFQSKDVTSYFALKSVKPLEAQNDH